MGRYERPGKGWPLGFVAAVVWAAVGGWLCSSAGYAALVGPTTVAVVRVEEDVGDAVRQAVAMAGGLAEVVTPGDVVVIKPDVGVAAPPESGLVTDPEVVRAVVRLVQEAGAEQVFIAEGAERATDEGRACTWAAFRAAGYDANGDHRDDVTGVLLIDLNDSGGTDVADPERVTRITTPDGAYWLPNVVVQADVLISVPVLKNHDRAGLALGLANLLGTLPGDLYHAPDALCGRGGLDNDADALARRVVALATTRPPDFVVVDGLRGVMDGPWGGTVAQPPMGLVLAGADGVAVDAVGALVMGYVPESVPYVAEATQAGLGTGDMAYIRVVGSPVAQVRRDFPVPYGDVALHRAEAQPPEVSLDVQAGVGVNEVVLAVGAQDASGVLRVLLEVDGQPWEEADTPPYRFVLDLRRLTVGRHTVRAVAYDRFLNAGEAQATVEVAATPTPSPTSTPSPTPTRTPTPLPTRPSPSPTAEPTALSPTATAVSPTPTQRPLSPSPTVARSTVPTVTPAHGGYTPEVTGTSPIPETPTVGMQPSAEPTSAAQPSFSPTLQETAREDRTPTVSGELPARRPGWWIGLTAGAVLLVGGTVWWLLRRR